MIKITDEFLQNLCVGLGNKQNINNVDCCITRLRITLVNPQLRESDEFFKQLGFVSIILPDDNILQLAFGSNVYEVKEKFIEYLDNIF